MDLRKPGEEEDEYSEMAEEAMDPDNCFPDSKNTHIHSAAVQFGELLTIVEDCLHAGQPIQPV